MLISGQKMSIIWSILIVFVIAYSILGWSLFFMQPSFLYHPVKDVTYNPGDIDLAYEKILFRADDGIKLSAWWVPAEKSKYTVLFCHGNGGNIAHRLDTINLLNELNLDVFIFDYRGYGSSKGKPTEQGTYLDARAAWDWLTEKRGIDPSRIIIFGRSLGGAVASQLASNVSPAGLVIESAFTSYVDMGKKFYPYMPVRLFACFSYNTLEHVRKVRCPVHVIHSRTDELVPFEFGLRLYDAAREPREFTEIFGCHNDGFLFSGEVYTQAWANWLNVLEKVDREAIAASIRKVP